jgi:regulator of PEP synthase PpsR (kinase-PPPase family)
MPNELEALDHPLVVGLTISPERLIAIRRNRLISMNQDEETDYVDPEMVRAEMNAARRIFSLQGWPVIDVTRRSIEETAAAILNLYQRPVEA